MYFAKNSNENKYNNGVKMKGILHFFVVAVITISIIHCGSKDQKKSKETATETTTVSKSDKNDYFDYGTIKGNTYINDFFGIELEYPKEWFVQSKATLDHLSKVGSELVAGDNNNLEKMIKASEINSANLLMVSQHELGATVASNPNIIIVVENTKNLPGIKTGKEYLFHAVKLLKASQLNFKYFNEDFDKKVINGNDFYTLSYGIDASASINSSEDAVVNQFYYTTVKKGFSISIILTYNTEPERKILLSMLDGLKVK